MRRRLSQIQLFTALHDREADWGAALLGNLLAGDEAARELGVQLARTLVAHARLVQDVVRGSRSSRSILASISDLDLMALCRTYHHDTQRAIQELSDEAWEAPIEPFADSVMWPVVRRSEMLWLALRDLVESLEACARQAGEVLLEPRRSSA